MKVRIKLLKDWTEYKKGQELELTKAFADMLIEQKTAELVVAEGDVKVVDDTKTKAVEDTKAKVVITDPEAVTKAIDDGVRKAMGDILGGTRSDGTSPVHIKVVKERIEDDPQKGFKHPRDFLMEIMSVTRKHTPESRWSDGLKCLHTARFSDYGDAIETKTAGSDEQGEYADPYGGFLIPIAYTPDLLKLDPEADPTSSLTRRIPMAGPRVEIRARVDKNHTDSVSGGLRVYRRMETDTAATSRIEFEKVVLEANSLFGVAFATEELLADSPISFTALLAQSFSDEFTSKIFSERLGGTGVGQFEGIKNTACKIEVTAETGQTADTIVWQNVLKMRARCWRYSQAIWLYNHDALTNLMTMTLPIGTAGHAMWHTSGTDDRPDMLLGRPAYATEYCETLGDAGDIWLCVWGEYLEGIMQPLQSAESIHVRFQDHERCFKCWMRNAGVPWWRSALTPKNSTGTLSPFVNLAART